jgi:hypothetical protein
METAAPPWRPWREERPLSRQAPLRPQSRDAATAFGKTVPVAQTTIW